MRILSDFKCPQGHVTEKLTESREITCHCGEAAERQISGTRIKLDPISGHFPGETMKWAKMRERQIKHEQKAND